MFIQSRIVSSENHSIRTSSVPSAMRTLRWIGHSRSFKVIVWNSLPAAVRHAVSLHSF